MGQRGKNQGLLVPRGEVSVQQVILLHSAVPFGVLSLFTPAMSCPPMQMLLVSCPQLFSSIWSNLTCLHIQKKKNEKLFATIHIPVVSLRASACP